MKNSALRLAWIQMLKPYVALFRIRLVNSIQYRAAALGGIFTQFAWGFMLILSFMAFYESNPDAFPMTLQQTISYIWIGQAFLALTMSWAYDYSIFDAIESGHISYDMVRPMDLYSRWFTTSTANRLAMAALRCIPILVVALILPEPFRLILPGSFSQFGLFVMTLFLGMMVAISMTMLVYVSAFFTISSAGTRMMFAIGMDFLTGGILPIPFFPAGIRRVMEVLPFGAVRDMPLRIYAGHIYGAELVQSIALQVFWLVVLVFIGRVWMHRALKHVIAQGG